MKQSCDAEIDALIRAANSFIAQCEAKVGEVAGG
jgi:hypothetical protein